MDMDVCTQKYKRCLVLIEVYRLRAKLMAGLARGTRGFEYSDDWHKKSRRYIRYAIKWRDISHKIKESMHR